MTRREQLNRFNKNAMMLVQYCIVNNIPIRLGETHRSRQQAERNAKMGIGIANSKHIYSLAIDIWIDPTGKNPVFPSHAKFMEYLPMYEEMGKFWESLGGKWGGRMTMKNGEKDYYHFEFEEKPAR